MVVGKWGFVCFLMIVGKLTNSLNLNGTTKTVLETNVQKDEATSKNETKTGIARNTTGSSKDNGGTVTVKTFNVDKASTRLPDMKENKASISEYQYMEITSSPNTVKAVNLDKLRLASTSETVTSGYSEKTPKTDTPISNETRQRTLSSTEAYIDQTSKIPMSRDATESSTSHEKQTTVSEDIDTTSKSAEGPSKDNGGTVTVNTFNVDKASTRLPDMKENKASIWEYPYMEITSSPNTVKAVYLVKLRLAPASASETVASGYSDKITLSSVIETVTSEYSGKTPKTDAVGYSSTKSQLVFTSETGLQAISADPNTVTVTLPFAIPPGFSKQSAVNTDTVIHASTTPISNETRQRTLSSTEAYVDQSSKIPMSRDATESSTRHEKQTTVSEDVDKSAEGKPVDSGKFNGIALVLVISLAVLVVVLFVCCICLIQRRWRCKRQTFTLPKSGPKHNSIESGVIDLRYSNSRNSTASLGGQNKFYSVALNDEQDETVFETKQSCINNRRAYVPEKPAVSTFLIKRTGDHHSVSNHENISSDIDNPNKDLPSDEPVGETI